MLVPGSRGLVAHRLALVAAALAGACLAAALASADPAVASAVKRALPDASAELVAQVGDDRFALLPSAGSGGTGDRAVRALVLFEQPRDRVFALLTETGRQREYRPELRLLEVVERFPDGEVDRQEMRIMLMTVSSWLRYHWDPSTSTIRWALDPRFPNDLRNIEGVWELDVVDAERTLGRFSSLVDVGPALPAFLEQAATRKNLPETLEHCRRWVDSGGTERP